MSRQSRSRKRTGGPPRCEDGLRGAARRHPSSPDLGSYPCSALTPTLRTASHRRRPECFQPWPGPVHGRWGGLSRRRSRASSSRSKMSRSPVPEVDAEHPSHGIIPSHPVESRRAVVRSRL